MNWTAAWRTLVSVTSLAAACGLFVAWLWVVGRFGFPALLSTAVALGAIWIVGGIYNSHKIELRYERERAEAKARATSPADMVALLTEARDLFRTYQAHHLAKIDEVGRSEKAERNRDIADRIDAAIAKVAR